LFVCCCSIDRLLFLDPQNYCCFGAFGFLSLEFGFFDSHPRKRKHTKIESKVDPGDFNWAPVESIKKKKKIVRRTTHGRYRAV
jgi:hypothetical protein